MVRPRRRFSLLLDSDPPESCVSRTWHEDAEHIFVTGRGVVMGDDGQRVLARIAARGQVDATADALTVAAADVPLTSLGLVVGDGAARDREGTDAEVRAAVVVGAAAQAVAAVLAVAADGPIAVQRAVADREAR